VTHLQASKHTSNIAGSHFHRQEQQICIKLSHFQVLLIFALPDGPVWLTAGVALTGFLI